MVVSGNRWQSNAAERVLKMCMSPVNGIATVTVCNVRICCYLEEIGRQPAETLMYQICHIKTL